MFACLYLPAGGTGVEPDALEAVARAFSPRVEVHRDDLVTLDVAGLRRLLGTPADIGRELAREARDRGCEAQVALAATRTTAMLIACARPGITIIPPGEEPRALDTLPIDLLRQLSLARSGQQAAGSGSTKNEARNQHAGWSLATDSRSKSTTLQINKSRNQQINKSPNDVVPVLDLFRRWGLRTLGEVGRLPAGALSARIGQEGRRWQQLARGEDLEPLVPQAEVPPIEETLELDWPVEGLEPLSFLLPRLLEPIAERLERLDQAAVTLEMRFRLASREQATRQLQLPAPMRDPKVLRTLILLHLESHPLGAGIDRLAIRVDPAPARVVQFSLLARALPFPEQMATLLARLGALMGERRVGAPALVDSYRPGAFAMKAFSVTETKADGGGEKAEGGERRDAARLVIRRFRLPVPARVMVQEGRPVRVTTERRGLEGGRVDAAAGPWRTSGDWWRVGEREAGVGDSLPAAGRLPRQSLPAPPSQAKAGQLPAAWNRDEWDVALGDGAVYRLYRDRVADRWFIDGIVD